MTSSAPRKKTDTGTNSGKKYLFYILSIAVCAIALITGSLWLAKGHLVVESIFGHGLSAAKTGPGYAVTDNAIRFFGGIWLSLGIALVISLRDPRRYSDLYRLVFSWMLTVFQKHPI